MAKQSWFMRAGNVRSNIPAASALFKTEANNHLKKKTVTVKGVVAIDFGQGDCNAIVAGTKNGANYPVLFFDMGGGSGVCSHTNPHHDKVRFNHCTWNNLGARIDTKYKPSVILSHWDKDHYFTAYKLQDRVKTLKWLVPRQEIGASCTKFVKGIKDIQCWPENGKTAMWFFLGRKEGVSRLYVEKADGGTSTDRNLTGLACTLEKRPPPRSGGRSKEIIMPGDAPYNVLRSLNGTRPKGGPTGVVRALFAYHHGSKTHLNFAKTSIPKAVKATTANPHALVFTYGLKQDGSNPYHHPDRDAMQAYKNKEWKTRVNTASNGPATTDKVTTGQKVNTRGDRKIFF